MSAKKRYYRYSGVRLDTAIATSAVVVIVATVLLFIDFNQNQRLCSVVFWIAALMNLIRGLKYIRRHEKARYIGAFVQAAVLLAVGFLFFFLTR